MRRPLSLNKTSVTVFYNQLLCISFAAHATDLIGEDISAMLRFPAG